ncbi:hypothetical protein FRB91_002141 [Serendipita sp. 411]|nr:hypothetical protein FRB91_002141 [Serendipita sp. 411]
MNDKTSSSNGTCHHYDSHWESLGRPNGSYKQWPNAMHIKAGTPWHISYIIGGLLFALGIAAGHHFYLSSFIASTDVRASPSQFWVRAINNVFSHAVAITLGIVCTYSTVQAVWYTAGSSPIPILTLNRLFLLPAPNAIWGLFRPPYSVHLIPPVLLALCMQTLIFVTIFSPNSLSSGPADSQITNVSVPTLTLSATDMSLNHRQLNQRLGAAIAPVWEQVISTAMTTPPTTYWRVPHGCGVACSYNLTYFAPGIDCYDLPNEEVTLPPMEINVYLHCSGRNSKFFEGSSIFVKNGMNGQDQNGSSAYWLLFQYITGDDGQRDDPRVDCPFYLRPPRAVRCTFREAMYRMSYNFSNSIQTVSSSLVKYGDPLPRVFPPITTRAVNYHALAKVFSASFHGDIEYRADQVFTNITSELALRQIFTLRERPQPFLFEPTDGQPELLGKSVIDLFTNMTIGVMAFRTDNTTVKALVWDGSIVWKYDGRTLWLVYGIAFALASLSSLYGLYCLWCNEGAIDPTFSTFLFTITRTEQLYKRFKTIRDMEEVEGTKIQFSSKAEAFFLVKERE